MKNMKFWILSDSPKFIQLTSSGTSDHIQDYLTKFPSQLYQIPLKTLFDHDIFVLKSILEIYLRASFE